MKTLLELDSVAARYGPVQALHDVSLVVREGEVVAVLGANGAGKTTTLRAISGTVSRSGAIELEGKQLKGGPESAAKAGIAHVPEGRGTFVDLTVTENLKLGAYTSRNRSVKADIQRIAEYFPWMTERGGQRAGTLSGGEQQMLALGRALMSHPRLLLLDEPSLGLAPMIVREFFRIVRKLNEEEGLTVLVVEQDARIALNASERAYVLEVGRVALTGTSAELARRRVRSTELPRLLMLAAAFTDFMQQIVSGLASGGIYALLALALVIIHRSTGVINFAQGEMATLSTYIAWTLTFNHGWSYWPAFVATLAISFVGGVGIHRAVIRPVERGSVLRIVIVTIGLLVAINGFVIWQWSGEPQQLQSPFGTETYDIGGVVVAAHDIGTIAVALGIVLLLWGLFQFTKVGLALRAAAVNPDEARLVGVRVTWMLALGWGLAALLGAVAGMLTAPTVGLDPNMMAAVLIYSFAAAVLGGIDSPIGAVVGGLAIGVLLNLLSYLSQYDMFSWFTEELRLPMALLIILAVLLIRPQGIFGKPEVKRV